MSSNCHSILIVDDNPNNLEILSQTLSQNNIHVAVALDGESAIEQVKYHLPDLILLDVMMPRIDGFETYKRLKQDYLTTNIPIIFMTALSEVDDKVKAFSMGAVDYITKPFQQEEVLVRVKTQLKLCELTKTLNEQNLFLKSQIKEKEQAEIVLLNLNDQLKIANSHLKIEIKERKRSVVELQKEVLKREKVERKLQQSLKQKEFLLKEIHHRVKNNLFVASSLVGLQANCIDNFEIIKFLEDTQDRIKTMALIHEHLYNSTNLEKIDFQKYVNSLTNQILYSHSYHNKNISLVLDVDSVSLNLETANPCGLIINELISNCLEHGFKEKSQGKIIIRFKKNNLNQFILIVKDDGVGFPESKHLYHRESLGLELVCTLVEQLEGKIELKNNNGTETIITFSELNYKQRI